MRTKDADERLRLLGQLDLGAAVEAMSGRNLWSIQREIATAMSKPRAKLVVPSCTASGKTMLAGRLALAFYNTYTPGSPCVTCDPKGNRGGCRGSKIITTSSKESHLRDNLWGEIRAGYHEMRTRGISVPGHLFDADLRLLDNESNHFIIGQSSSTPEGMQGYHAAHKLIIGDEATSVDTEVELAITRLMSSGDSRILLIYNPLGPDTYPSRMGRGNYDVIRIRAWDTPGFTGEEMPRGANLMTPVYTTELKESGHGPGSLVWETTIEAKDWNIGENVLIPGEWYVRQSGRDPVLGRGSRQLGIDIASYGTDENVIAVRDGNQVIAILGFPSMMVSDFVRGPVTEAVMKYQPENIVFDGDGVGAGAVGYFEDLRKMMPVGGNVMGFRGGKGVSGRYTNMRAQAYWALRMRFENAGIIVAVNDPLFESQITNIKYSIPVGDIRIESKQEMRKRGVGSPDRADAVMYAFAFSDELAVGNTTQGSVLDEFGLVNLSDRTKHTIPIKRIHHDINPVTGIPDYL